MADELERVFPAFVLELYAWDLPDFSRVAAVKNFAKQHRGLLVQNQEPRT